MNCSDVDHALIDVGSTATHFSHQAREHVMGCKRCQELVHALNIPVTADAPSSEILRQIERGIVADLHPVRPLATARYLFAIFAGIFVSVVALGAYRMGAFAIAVMSPVQASAILGALAASAGLLAYSLIQQMVPGSRHHIPPRWLTAGILISLTVAIAVLFQFQHDRDFWKHGWACLRAGTPIGIIAALPIWLVLRRGAILSPGMTGAASGLFAGLVGTSVLEIHCPNLDAWHILVAHLGVSVLCALAGLVVGFAAEIIAGRRRKIAQST
jgi:hypothetical protein